MRKEKLWHGSTSSLFPTVDTEVMRKPMMTLLLFTLGHSVIREKNVLFLSRRIVLTALILLVDDTIFSELN